MLSRLKVLIKAVQDTADDEVDDTHLALREHGDFIGLDRQVDVSATAQETGVCFPW